MTIGEALKEERQSLGLTQKEMIAGTKVSLSHYSRVENGVRKIDADDLFEILTLRKVDSESFVKKYLSSGMNYEKILEERIIQNFTEHDLATAQKTKDEIEKYSTDNNLKYRSILIVAVLEGNIKSLDKNVKDKILKQIFLGTQWYQKEYSLRLFGDSMLLFNFSDLKILMKGFLSKIRSVHQQETSMQEAIAGICVNFLENCYQNHDLELSDETLQLLNSLPCKPTLFFYKLLGVYYQYLFKKDMKNVEKIKSEISQIGFNEYIKNLPV